MPISITTVDLKKQNLLLLGSDLALISRKTLDNETFVLRATLLQNWFWFDVIQCSVRCK